MTQRVVPIALLLLLLPIAVLAQVDPGVRPGAAGAGTALASVLANNPATILAFFQDAEDRFEEVDSVAGALAGEEGFGLGPRFNSRSCVACHAQPATGGSAPAVNPQVADATAHGAQNTVPSFITLSGPVREARFIFFTDIFGFPDPSKPNGGVEDLYTIAGRVDAPGCTTAVISQPSFATQVANNNVIFRIPTPVFGAGLMENIEESTLLANQQAQSGNPYGIAGTFNHNGNDGTISRFGWKAQNKSLEIFAGEAYNVEMGVSNELFTQERPLPREDMNSGLPVQCRLNPTPEDRTNFNTTPIGTLSDTVQFAMFMRLLEQPTPSTTVPGGATSINNGKALFNAIGCNVCHTPAMTTNASRITPSLGNVSAKLFSDLQIHHMGVTLADNVSQGGAGGDQFRTAPLWGLGKRIFFLHDGRTKDLVVAIRAHNASGSEANGPSFTFFTNLSTSQRQDIVNFLRSL
jgi:CxxC motif-containing protein (DUF1111 family)